MTSQPTTSRAQTVLIADDEPHVVQIVSYKLEQAGFTVFIARNGQQAYEIAATQTRPSIVVTDFQMPGGTGLELARRLRANAATAEIPVLMLTGRGYKISPAELAQTNIQHVMDKPFSPTELVGRVGELLQQAGIRAAGEAAA